MESLIRLWKSRDVPLAAVQLFTWIWELIGCDAGTLESMSIHRLAMTCDLTEGQTRDRLKSLERCGLVERDETGRGEFTLYVFRPFAPKIDRPTGRKKIKPTPLLDLAEKHSENPSGKQRENPTEFQREKADQPKVLQRKYLATKSAQLLDADPGGKEKQENIKVKKERVFSKPSFEKTIRRIESNNPEWLNRCRDMILKSIKEKDLSPDLVDRIAAGMALKLPGFDTEAMQDVCKEAHERQKTGIIKRRYIHIAKYVRDVYEANGYDWTPCRSARRAKLENAVAGVK